MCHMQELLLPLAALLSYLPRMNFIGESLCAQTLMLCAIMVALPCWPFELSPLNELYRGKLVPSVTLKPYEIF